MAKRSLRVHEHQKAGLMSPLEISLAKDILIQAQSKLSSVLPQPWHPYSHPLSAVGELLLSRYGTRIPSDLPADC